MLTIPKISDLNYTKRTDLLLRFPGNPWRDNPRALRLGTGGLISPAINSAPLKLSDSTQVISRKGSLYYLPPQLPTRNFGGATSAELQLYRRSTVAAKNLPRLLRGSPRTCSNSRGRWESREGCWPGRQKHRLGPFGAGFQFQF